MTTWQKHYSSNINVFLLFCWYLKFLAIGDFIRKTPNPIISPVHPQPRNLLQQSLVPSSMVPD